MEVMRGEGRGGGALLKQEQLHEVSPHSFYCNLAVVHSRLPVYVSFDREIRSFYA